MDFNKIKDSEIPESWTYLTTAENEFEYNVIKGKLTESNIVCVGKGKNFGLLDSGLLNIVLGPCIPVDILVPVEMYEEAKQIIDLEISDEELEKQAIAQENKEENLDE
jgi:hypothetical protein